MSIGGFLFEKESRISFEREWRTVLEEHRLQYFRMVECAHLNRQFEGRNREESIEVEKKLIALISKTQLAGVAFSVDMTLSHLLPISIARSIRVSPYSFCCFMAINSIKDWLLHKGIEGSVAFFFESGAKHDREADQIIHGMMDRERSREGFRYDSHTFALKKDVIALQCADFLAWHWGKAVKIRAEGGKPREDLRALWEGGGRRFYCQHYDKEKLMALSTEAIEYQKNRKWNSKTQSWEEN